MSDSTDIINSFAIFASVKLLWNVLAIYKKTKADYKAFRNAITVLSEELFIMGIHCIHDEYG